MNGRRIVDLSSFLFCSLYAFWGQGSYAQSTEALAKIQGRVVLEGKEVATELQTELNRVVIYAVGFSEAAPSDVKAVEQKETNFSPNVLPITRGQKVRFANVDTLVHNVFSTSEAKEFDLGDQSPGTQQEITFNKTGLVQIFCNIHPQMSLNVLVLPNRRFTQPTSEGLYSLAGLPRKKLKIFAFHPRARAGSLDVDLSSGEVHHDFKLVLSKTPPAHLNKHGKPYKKSKY